VNRLERLILGASVRRSLRGPGSFVAVACGVVGGRLHAVAVDAMMEALACATRELRELEPEQPDGGHADRSAVRDDQRRAAQGDELGRGVWTRVANSATASSPGGGSPPSRPR
jgi:hypothetical protein